MISEIEKVTVVLEDVANQLEETMDSWEQYLNTATGEFVSLSDVSFIETDEELAEEIDSSDDYIRLPNQRDINEYRIMEDFAVDFQDAEKRAKLFRALNSRKPFRTFKDTLNNCGIADDYYTFRYSEFINIAREWCEANKIMYTAAREHVPYSCER